MTTWLTAHPGVTYIEILTSSSWLCDNSSGSQRSYADTAQNILASICFSMEGYVLSLQ